MQVIETTIPEVKIIKPKKFGDHRGFFSETYNRKTFAEHEIEISRLEGSPIKRP